MPVTKLPKKLHAQLDHLADRVRRIRTVRAIGRAAFVLPLVALACIVVDAYLNLPALVRSGLFAGWVVLALREAWNILRARSAEVDLEAVASAVESEFPRLAERLTTAVELAGSNDISNGSPALIDEVIQDADSRARKLDLAVAFPAGGSVAGFITAMALLVALLAPAFFAPRGSEYLRRFFAPWYSPSTKPNYRLVVTSGDQAVKRGDPVTLSAYVEPTKPDAVLPNSLVAILSIKGKDERVAMSSDEPNVWHLKRPAAEGDFDYRIEAGPLVSEPAHVTVVEPVTLAAARVTVSPPAYATAGREPAAIEGLGELSAIEHSTVTFDLRFLPRPTIANLDFQPDATADDKPAKERTVLKVAEDGSVQVTLPARKSGTFLLTAEGRLGVKSDFPPQPLRVHPDEAPKFTHVTGLSDKPRQVRPTEKLVVECTATDDVAVAALVLEWRVNGGATKSLPLDARNLNGPQAEGRISVSLADKVKAKDKFECRLAAIDNRNLPELKLRPQTTYFPPKDAWTEFEIDPRAEPLAEQDILQRKNEIESKLKEIQQELKAESRAADLLKRGTRNSKSLDAAEREKLADVELRLKETTAKLDDLSKDVGLTPELGRLSNAMRQIADRELRDAESALGKVREETKPEPRTAQFARATESIDEAHKKIGDLIKENEQIAKDRLDRRKLEDLAAEQRDLADKARTADSKGAAELAKKQKALEEQLNKLKEQSESIRQAADSARAEEAQKLADAAKKIADEMRDLNAAMKRGEKDSLEQRLADLKKKQDELAKKAKDLADKTDAASRISETPPLKPEDADKARAALEKGNLDEAVKDQEKARLELERLARDLEAAAAQSRDPREAAKQLARLQDDLRQRVAQETARTPLDQLPAERREAFQKQQEAIEKAAGRLKTTEPGADLAKQIAVRDAADARKLLEKGAANGTDKKMREAKESLDKLAEKLPTKDQRLARARDEVARLKQQQDEIRQRADAAAKAAEKQDPDSPAAQRELAKKLADTAKKQAELADQLNKLDAPGHDARRDKATDALNRAAADLTAGRPQDAAASQQAARRELDRLEQALNGQQPADDKVAELNRKQKAIADDAAKAGPSPDKSTQQDLLKRQEEVAREAAKLQTPEAATAQADAMDAAKKAESAGRDASKPDDFAKKARDAANKFERLDQRVNSREPPAETADRLAKKQKENADAQAKKPDNASTGEARRKAAQELEELKNLRPGPDGQKAKQQAQDALQRAANHLDPTANTKAQKEAAEALADLAERLSRDQTARKNPDDPDEAADQLAKKQRDLAEQMKKDRDAARQKPGDEGKKAEKEALDRAAQAQKDLARQASEMAGRDSPKDLQQAQDAMNKAQGELDRENFEGAQPKQKEAADALDRLSRETKKQQQERATAQHPDQPSRQQADAAKQLADEQRTLRDEAMQAAEQLAKENARADNPVEDLARQQAEVARQAGELAKTVADRQGEKADQSKQARQAADAAKQTSERVKNGDLNQAKESGKQAADSLEKLGQDKASGDSGQKAKDLARQQGDINKKLDELAKDPGAARAQQNARQQQLENQARDLGQKLEQMGQQPGQDGQPSPAGQQAKSAGNSAKQAGDKMQAAKEAGRKGSPGQAGEARDQAAQSMDKAAQQAGDAAKQLGGEQPGSPGAGKALGQAKDQMGEAGKRLGAGQPNEAGGSMEKAADALQQAANQLGKPGQPGMGEGEPGQGGPGGPKSGGNVGAPGGKLDLRQFSPDVAKHSGKAWGELPGEIKTKVIQEMKGRYGEEYARSIKLYFEQLAERK